MSPLSFFRGWMVWVVLVAALGAAVLWQRAEVARTESEFTQWKLTAEENRLLADRAQRDLERRREDNTRKAIDESKTQTLVARAAAARADVARGRVSGQLAAYIAAVRRASAEPPAALGGETTGDPIGVLADVLGRADRRAGILAAYADRARVAGQTCERYADGLEGK